MFRADLVQGKAALVTGRRHRMGRIMTERFVELGADCVICGRRGSVLEETARQVMAKHRAGRSRPTPSISGSPTAVEALIVRIWATGRSNGSSQTHAQFCTTVKIHTDNSPLLR